MASKFSTSLVELKWRKVIRSAVVYLDLGLHPNLESTFHGCGLSSSSRYFQTLSDQMFTLRLLAVNSGYAVSGIPDESRGER